jgi:glycolate oxidase iron-sulfur subunit
MQAMATGELALTPRLVSHLDSCLGCRACENVCPARVAYGVLIDNARGFIRAHLSSSGPSRRVHKILLPLLYRSLNQRWLATLLRCYRISGLQWLMRSTKLLKLLGLARLEAELPVVRSTTHWHAAYPAEGERRGTVALFTGCVTNLADQDTLKSSIRLLNRLGYEVRVPTNQVCCGALYRHEGEVEKFTSLVRQNIAAFEIDDVDAIVITASGCAVTLTEYGNILSDDPTARRFSKKVVDINQFLSSQRWPNDIILAPLHKRIALHDPCSLTHVLRQPQAPYTLLQKIPGVEIIPLPENQLCCGAAGSYHLTQAVMADSLRRDKIEHLRRLAPDILATSNVGCALFLAAGIKEAGLNIQLMHPIKLLEGQLQGAELG